MCIVLYLYTQWQILGRDYLLVLLLIEVDISRRVEDALLRKSGNCAWLLRSCCGPFLCVQMVQLKAQLHQCRTKSRTTTQWVDCLIQPIFIMLVFVRGERASCAEKEMMPCSFCLYAFQVHARYGILYIRSTHHIHSTLLECLWQAIMS